MPVGTQDTQASRPGRHRRRHRSAVPGRHRRRPGLAQVVRRATSVAICITAGLAAGFGVVPAMSAAPALFAGEADDGSTQVAPPPSPAERLVVENDCWTGSAPGSTVPRRAVVTLPGEGAKVAGSEVGFELWLGPDRTPGTGDERAGQLHAFCP